MYSTAARRLKRSAFGITYERSLYTQRWTQHHALLTALLLCLRDQTNRTELVMGGICAEAVLGALSIAQTEMTETDLFRIAPGRRLLSKYYITIGRS